MNLLKKMFFNSNLDFSRFVAFCRRRPCKFSCFQVEFVGKKRQHNKKNHISLCLALSHKPRHKINKSCLVCICNFKTKLVVKRSKAKSIFSLGTFFSADFILKQTYLNRRIVSKHKSLAEINRSFANNSLTYLTLQFLVASLAKIDNLLGSPDPIILAKNKINLF